MALNFEGTYQVNAPREKVWDFVIDPTKIGKCLPDLKSLEVEDENKFTAIARVGIGFMKGDFKFQLAIVEQNPPSHARLKGTGTGVGSSVNMDTSIDLAEADGGTKLTYNANVQIGGTLASVGQRVIGGTVEKTIAEVFGCVKKQLEA
jgi:carbon monoxide dehydrogenase subunit G